MIIDTINDYLQSIFKNLDFPTDEIKVISSNRKDLCDYQYDGLFKLAKSMHKSPMEIGKCILEEIEKTKETKNYFLKVELLPPGFINFTLSDKFINEMLNKMIDSPHFAIHFPQKKKIIIDYGGPNIAKPLHVGHLRSAIVGEAIKRILKYAGNEVIADVHLGDYGLQIGQVIYGLKEKQITVEEITLEELEKIYPDLSARCKIDKELKQKCAEITKELQEKNEEYQKYFEKIKEISGQDILRIYRYLDVSFDVWKGESDAYPYIEKLTKILEKENLLQESEGAKIIDISKATDKKVMPPFIYQKSNGAYLYSTTDLGTIYDRVLNEHPDTIIYVTDYRQKEHFLSLFRVCEKLDFAQNIKLEHIGFGTVNGPDGKPYKTRSGKSPKLDDLLQEVKDIFVASSEKNTNMKQEDLDIIVNAIIKFADLQNNYEKDYIFDIHKFASVNGKTGPYLLYTYLRIQSILNKEKNPLMKLNEKIYNEKDRDLRIKILELENIFLSTLENRSPSILANFIYDLAVIMNAFYETNHINNLEEQEIKENWLVLLNLANKVIFEMLNLLGIKIPERM